MSINILQDRSQKDGHDDLAPDVITYTTLLKVSSAILYTLHNNLDGWQDLCNANDPFLVQYPTIICIGFA